MRHIVDRAYAPHRMAHHDQAKCRQRSEAARSVLWAILYFLLLGAMMLSGWLG